MSAMTHSYLFNHSHLHTQAPTQIRNYTVTTYNHYTVTWSCN